MVVRDWYNMIGIGSSGLENVVVNARTVILIERSFKSEQNIGVVSRAQDRFGILRYNEKMRFTLSKLFLALAAQQTK